MFPSSSIIITAGFPSALFSLEIISVSMTIIPHPVLLTMTSSSLCRFTASLYLIFKPFGKSCMIFLLSIFYFKRFFLFFLGFSPAVPYRSFFFLSFPIAAARMHFIAPYRLFERLFGCPPISKPRGYRMPAYARYTRPFEYVVCFPVAGNQDLVFPCFILFSFFWRFCQCSFHIPFFPVYPRCYQVFRYARFFLPFAQRFCYSVTGDFTLWGPIPLNDCVFPLHFLYGAYCTLSFIFDKISMKD